MIKKYTNDTVRPTRPWGDIKTWANVRQQLVDIIELSETSPIKVFQDAGLSRDTYYKTFNPKRAKSPMRETSVKGIARALNLSLAYIDYFPYFGYVSPQARKGLSILEIAKQAIDNTAGIEQLARDSSIPMEELYNILEPSGPKLAIPISYFCMLMEALNLNISNYSDNSIGVIDGSREISRFDQYLEKDILALPITELDTHSADVTDRGLLELLTPQNRLKHSITGQEIEELTFLHLSRISDATISHWITVLYSIRGLSGH